MQSALASFKRNARYGTDSTHGRVPALWHLIGFNSACGCVATTPLMILNLALGGITLGVGINGVVKREHLASTDAARYGTAASPAFDVSFFDFLCVMWYHVFVMGLAYVHAGETPSVVRETEGDGAPRRRKLSLAVEATRFAYEFAWTGSTVMLVLYIVFAAKNGHHTHPDDVGFFVWLWLDMFIVTALTAAHTQFEHVVWIIAVGLFYAFCLSPVHYASLPQWETRPYVYAVVDWSRPAATVANVAAVSALTVLVHAVLSTVSWYKNLGSAYVAYAPGEDPADAAAAAAAAAAEEREPLPGSRV